MNTQSVNAQILPREALNNPELIFSAAVNFTSEPASATETAVGAKQSLRANAVTIALAISNGTTRQHIAQMLDGANADIRARTSAELTRVVDLDGDQAKVLDWLQKYFSDATARRLILISNLLKAPSDPIDGFLTRECQKRFAEQALGTIAILQSRERLTDIDRTIAPDVTRDDLAHAMVMLLGRLEYVIAPVPEAEVGRTPSQISGSLFL